MIDDRKSVPFLAIEMIIPLTTREIAERAYGGREVTREHPILYSTNKDKF